MNKGNEMMLVADLEFKCNRGIIKNCVIFDTEKVGESSVQDKDKINEIINRRNHFMFQNSCVNGKTSIELLKSYNIHQVNGNEI